MEDNCIQDTVPVEEVALVDYLMVVVDIDRPVKVVGVVVDHRMTAAAEAVEVEDILPLVAAEGIRSYHQAAAVVVAAVAEEEVALGDILEPEEGVLQNMERTKPVVVVRLCLAAAGHHLVGRVRLDMEAVVVGE